MTRNQPEFQLHCLAADLLRLQAYPEIVWFHPPNGEYRSARTGARLKRMGVQRGVADFIILKTGQAIALEIKAKGGRLTADQTIFRDRWKDAGGTFVLATGWEEIVTELEFLRIIKPVKGSERFEPRSHAA